MFLLILSTVSLIASILILVLIAYDALQDTRKVGTALLPLYKWCSAKHFSIGLSVAALLGESSVGVVIGADPMSSFFTLQVLKLTIGGTALWCAFYYGVFNYFWTRAENKWAPLMVLSTSNCYCTYCGARVTEKKPLGGYCPVCSAAPDKECDPFRHERYETQGDPLPKKGKKNKMGSRHFQGARR